MSSVRIHGNLQGTTHSTRQMNYLQMHNKKCSAQQFAIELWPYVIATTTIKFSGGREKHNGSTRSIDTKLSYCHVTVTWSPCELQVSVFIAHSSWVSVCVYCRILTGHSSRLSVGGVINFLNLIPPCFCIARERERQIDITLDWSADSWNT